MGLIHRVSAFSALGFLRGLAARRVGEPRAPFDEGYFQSGSAYLFKEPDGDWQCSCTLTEDEKVTLNHTSLFQHFGFALALSAESSGAQILVVGAPFVTVIGDEGISRLRQGAVEIFCDESDVGACGEGARRGE
jgi:hypothetical protein